MFWKERAGRRWGEKRGAPPQPPLLMGIPTFARVQTLPSHPQGGVLGGDVGAGPPGKRDRVVVFNPDGKHQASAAGAGLGGPRWGTPGPAGSRTQPGVRGSPACRGGQAG